MKIDLKERMKVLKPNLIGSECLVEASRGRKSPSKKYADGININLCLGKTLRDLVKLWLSKDEFIDTVTNGGMKMKYCYLCAVHFLCSTLKSRAG